MSKLIHHSETMQFCKSLTHSRKPACYDTTLLGIVDNERFIREFLLELRKIAVLNLSVAISLVDVDNFIELFSTRRYVKAKKLNPLHDFTKFLFFQL